MTLREEIYELDHFLRMVDSVFIEHRSGGGWARKYQWFLFGKCIDTIKLLVERHKSFYSVGLGNIWCSISAKMDRGRALIHEFLCMSNLYYEIKCSPGTLMAENHYSLYVVCCNPCLNKRKLIGSVAPCHRFVARIRSLNGAEGVTSSTSQDSLLNKLFQLSPLGALASRRTWKCLATKLGTTKN